MYISLLFVVKLYYFACSLSVLSLKYLEGDISYPVFGFGS
jgi:hypothetical protein